MDISEKYANAYAEVWEILKYLPKEEYQRIPKDELDFYDAHRNRTHNFKIDPRKPLDEQNISREANAVMVTIYRDYFATPEQRRLLHKALELNSIKERLKKYSELIEDDDS